jgi:hypothetical protein
MAPKCRPRRAPETSRHHIQLALEKDYRPQADETGNKTDEDRRAGANPAAGGGDGDEAGNQTRSAAEQARMAAEDPLAAGPRQGRGTRCNRRVEDDEGCQAIGLEVGTSVEAVPAEEQKARAGEHKGEIVRGHQILAETDALAEHQGADEARDTGVDVNDRAAGKVDGAPLEQVAIRGIHDAA